MATQSFQRLLFISLCLAVAAVSARPSPGGRRNSALKRICGNTDHPALCLSTVAPFLKGKPTVDAVLDASVKAASSYGQYAIGELNKMAQKASPQMRSTYTDCVGFYQTALESFHSALKAHPARDLGSMKSELSSAITWLETCEDEFAESGEPSPTTQLAQKLQSLTSDSLAIVDQLH